MVRIDIIAAFQAAFPDAVVLLEPQPPYLGVHVAHTLDGMTTQEAFERFQATADLLSWAGVQNLLWLDDI